MPFQVSPGVNVSEIDLTTVVPAVSSTTGAIAGQYHWGPVAKRVLVDSENTLVSQFGEPDSNNYQEWFTAANFLAYANALYVARVENGANNASTAGVGRYVKNDDDYDQNYSTGITGGGDWVAKYPGAIGNSLKVSVCVSANAYTSTLTANLEFQAGNTTIRTVGAAAGTTTVDLTGSVVSGDVIFLQSAGINLGDGLSVTNVSATAITVATAPTQTQLGTSNNTALVFANTAVRAAERRWEYYNNFDAAPGTSTYVSNKGGANDELHIAVVDQDGEFTEVNGQVIEAWSNVSRALGAQTTDGASNYYKDVINNRSGYLWWASHVDSMTGAGSAATTTFSVTSDKAVTNSLSGGDDGIAPTNSQIIDGYNLFQNAEEIDVSLVLGADANATVAAHLVQNICETRLDCIALLSLESGDVVNNSSYAGKEAEDSVTYRNTLPSSSYGVLDGAWKYQYDKYNDVYRYVPMNGDTAGLMVRTDTTRDPWFSPAGFNRGQIKNVVKLSYNAKKSERDTLYKAGINPVVAFPGQGTILFGDKTMLSQPSAFDRINVRRLFIVLEKAISTAAKFSLFEFNDAFTRSQFRNLVEPFLRDVQGRRGITDFRVVCDETNNTSDVINRNEFVGDIYIKPARSINFIQLNFVAVRSGVEFEEVVGQF
jgi:phage tail sheath protein FI